MLSTRRCLSDRQVGESQADVERRRASLRRRQERHVRSSRLHFARHGTALPNRSMRRRISSGLRFVPIWVSALKLAWTSLIACCKAVRTGAFAACLARRSVTSLVSSSTLRWYLKSNSFLYSSSLLLLSAWCSICQFDRINRRFPSPPALRPAAAAPSRHGAVTHQTAAHTPG